MHLFRRQADGPTDADMWLVAGLGNPGKQYERTRHNIGFMVVDALAVRHGVRLTRGKHEADVVRTTIQDVPVLLAEPLTYMNDSGYAVGRIARYYHIPPARVLVICDDLDLPFGTLRLRPGGSSGGQRGLQSVLQVLGTNEVPRLRLGVGRPPRDAVGHVLQAFPATEAKLLPALLDVACDAVTAILTDGVAKAMNRYNRDWSAELASGRT